MTLGYNKPLYILLFDHRATFQTGMFSWGGALSPEQTAQIAAAKQVIYDGLKAAGVSGFIGFAVRRRSPKSRGGTGSGSTSSKELVCPESGISNLTEAAP
jgi:hypothetical protein